ncbi:hypothetical protein NH340_JMT00354 [Sarcoptes scabiei]|nr:hypothetical protein NH340_JMT00354 [Sarcoptes scabiei]
MAALSSSVSSSSTGDQPSATITATPNTALLRQLSASSPNVSTKTIPIVLMQSPQNPNSLIGQTCSGSVSLINIGTASNSGSNNQIISNQPIRSIVSNKITTATQTSGANIGSILSAAAAKASSGTTESQYSQTTNNKVTTNSSGSNNITAKASTTASSNASNETISPLVEALRSTIKSASPIIKQSETKDDN